MIKTQCLLSAFLLLTVTCASAQVTCNTTGMNNTPLYGSRSEVQEYHFTFPGLKIASLTDGSLATGATVFLFPKKSTASYDARGGSVAAVETTLLDEGSYSNEIDGISFAGGSTMGLDVAQGVRSKIFAANAAHGSDWDIIPSIPGAVIYDYGARKEPTQNRLIYPDQCMGQKLYDNAREGTMLVGRAGAGTSATANKSSKPIWGGQGADVQTVTLPGNIPAKIFAAVVLNAAGDIMLPNNVVIDEKALEQLRREGVPHGSKQNTTLSLIITDISLNRSQLKRLAIMVHSSMGRMIFPFHSLTDGDIIYTVSMNRVKLPEDEDMLLEAEEALQGFAAAGMQNALIRSVSTANKGSRDPQR